MTGEGLRKGAGYVNIDTNRIEIVSGSSRPPHSHKDIEILYVLEGNVDIRISERVYSAEAQDIILINSGEEHSFQMSEKGLVSLISLDYYELQRILKRSKPSFLCNSVAEPEKNYSKHRYILEAMLERCTDETQILVFASLYYSFLEVLKTNNLESDKVGQESGAHNRMKKALEFVESHYMEQISLTELAEKEYMSVSAFSRLFRKESGSNFMEYLRKIRLEHAECDLIHTNKTVTEIAEDCGFANISSFNKSFKQKHMISPKEYRNKMSRSGVGNKEEQKQRLRVYFQNRKSTDKKKTNVRYAIRADLTTAEPFHNGILLCMNAGKFAELLEGKVQKHVAKVVRSLGVNYIRIYNPFDYALQIRSDHETKKLNFEKLDAVLDFLTELGCIPVIELPDRKKKLVVNIGTQQQEEVIDPKLIFLSIQEWEEALSTLLDHIVKRYTVREVSHWMFEIWYDAEHVTGSGQIPYERLYERTWKVIRKYIPHAAIGGSGLSSEMEQGTLEHQLRWWKNRDDRPDFLTFISYPYRVKKKEGPNYDLLKIESDLHWVKYDLDRYYSLMRSIGYPDTPVWISEWNTSLSERNIYNDSCAKACHMLVQMADAVGNVAAMAYGNISDCTSQYYDSVSPLIGATGLVTRDGLMKPAYYAMEFWRNLGDRLVKRGENFIITTQNHDSIQIIIFHAKKFGTGYYVKEESQILADELPYVFQDNQDGNYTFDLYPIPDGRKKVCIYRIAESYGNVLAEWGKLGYTDNLMRSEITYLEKICIPRMEVRYLQTENERLVLSITLKANEIVLIQIL